MIKNKRLSGGTIRTILFTILGAVSFLGVFSVLGTTHKVEKSNTASPNIEVSNAQYVFFSVPSAVSWADESAPLTDFEVHERIDHELVINTYRHSTTILAFKRANRYFPIIEPILQKYGVPDDFKYLAVIESNLANVTSPLDAVGVWQFLEKTGRQYGLEINEEVDERYDLEKATIAACKYLKEAYRKFGSWTLAAASYNIGMAGLSEQLRTQKVNSYYDLRLNNETARYVPRLLATKTIFEHPEKFGFLFTEKDVYPLIPTQNVMVNEAVPSWVDFALAHNTTYKMVRALNPWIRKPYLKNTSEKTYTIKLLDTSKTIYQE